MATDKHEGPPNMSSVFKAAAALAEEIEQLESQAATKRQQLSELMGPAPPLFSINDPGLEEDYGDITRSVRTVMKANRGRTMSGDEVAKLIGAANVNSIRSLMNRLADRDKGLKSGIKKVSRGRYIYS